MDHKEKISYCRGQAAKFRRPDLFNDLIQEGYVAILEAEDRGTTNPATLSWVAKRAMMDFISLKQRAVSIPASEITRKNAAAIRRGEDEPVTPNTSQNTFDCLRNAIEGVSEVPTGDERAIEDPTETLYFMKEVEEFMRKSLNTNDFKIYQYVYGPAQLTLEEVADRMKMSQRNVYYRQNVIKRILAMLRDDFSR